jgi:hypothetical protein
MDETEIPGVASDGVSSDIFGTPSGAAWDAAKLIFGDWLELVFNDVGSGSATIMTHVAGYVNFLAYVLITVIMSYVLIASVIKTASEGKVMGNGWSTVWLPLRTFLACFLIFPVGIGQASTISFIQVSVAWLGMVGSNAADRVAAFVVQNLTKKAFRVSTQVQGYKVISDMTKMGFCASGFNVGLGDSYDKPNGPDGLYGRVADGGSDTGPGSEYRLQNIPITTSLKDKNVVYVGHDGRCGELLRPRMELKGEYDSDFSSDAFEIILDYQTKVYDEVVMKMSDYNYQSYMSVLSGSNSGADEAEDMRGNASLAAANFLNLIEGYENDMAQLFVDATSASGENNNLIDHEVTSDGNFIVRINESEYSDLGWAYLGAYYTLLSKAIGEVAEVAKSVADISSFDSPNGCKYATQDTWVDSLKFWQWDDEEEKCLYNEEFTKNEIVIEQASIIIGNDFEGGNEINKLSSACTDRKNCSPDLVEKSFASAIGKPFFEYQDHFGGVSEGAANSVARDFISILGWGNSEIMGIENLTDEDGTETIAPGALYISDPITFTSRLGHNIVYAVAGARATLGFLEGIAESGKNVRTFGVAPVAAFFGGILAFLVDFLQVIIALIYPQAAAMAYFLPLLPSLIWAMAFLSWLLMYAEAIFNAPLAVTLMATPEGEGIAGSRMERKIAMLAALILKPTFLIVGLLLSMMILSIGFVFLNQIFWMAAASVTWRFDPIAVVALITIWFSIITIFMHNTFKIIPTFADNSLEWFLGGIARTFGNDLDNMTSDQFSNSFKGQDSLSKGTGKSVGVFAKSIGGDNASASKDKQGAIGNSNTDASRNA